MGKQDEQAGLALLQGFDLAAEKRQGLVGRE